ncbi:Uncharacterised protein [Mycobacteroides abscessus]|uniref:hypothetical protein n=1 Tax=Mycobacteroides abscessus TaxID=36809 RepID=UPI00030FFA96|nr:hypothetical protein [Mycobacteroides abscessus]CPT65826.1 Uncharacterised protein [Mycobacteroides abscessus]CPU59502.1 Uncharacterised protein [Mycobacteroides abscessus]SKJ89670.1 Uncharacterised protein [Mycobacteroides abscessus subsp. massiliense]SKP96930.1 Uncharacterised protein [Mycobacteroides abscessus subsp. massiliense]SKV60952.1 Uncharacterised protein [Mycobacteroides abscessus subsp. massiliense]
MNPDDMSAVAVVHGDADRMAIWHVAAEPIVQTSRLCGAWLTEDRDIQRKVVATRKVVLADDEPNDAIKALLTHASGVIDLKATLVAIEQYTDGLNEIHRASPTPKGSSRAPISWPAPVPIPDWALSPQVLVGVVDDPLIRTTITVARWFADLASVWSAIETVRTARSHLSSGSTSLRPLPFVIDG